MRIDLVARAQRSRMLEVVAPVAAMAVAIADRRSASSR